MILAEALYEVESNTYGREDEVALINMIVPCIHMLSLTKEFPGLPLQSFTTTTRTITETPKTPYNLPQLKAEEIRTLSMSCHCNNREAVS